MKNGVRLPGIWKWRRRKGAGLKHQLLRRRGSHVAWTTSIAQIFFTRALSSRTLGPNRPIEPATFPSAPKNGAAIATAPWMSSLLLTA